MNRSIVINYENIEYTIWFSNDLKLCCNKKIDGKFVLGLDDNDKKIIGDVIGSLCVSNENSYFIRNDSFNGVSYNLFYDYSKFLYFTDSLDDSVNSFVNLKYNNLSSVYTSKDSFYNQYIESHKLDAFNRRIKNGLIRFSVGASVSLLLMNYATKTGSGVLTYDMFSEDVKTYIQSSLTIDNSYNMVSGEISFSELNINNVSTVDNYDLQSVTTSAQNVDSITFDDMRLALESNPNVDSDFKEFFNKLDFAFNDSMNYVNFDSSILEKLKTLKVEYNFDSPRAEIANGEYYTIQNKIVYYSVRNFSELNPNTALHELGHVFQSVNTDNLCFELSNEIWTVETIRAMVDRGLLSSDLFNKDARGNIIQVNGYTNRLFLYYYLMELLPVDAINKFQWSPDDFILVSSLADMNNEYEVNLVHEILDLINECEGDAYLQQSGERIVQIKQDLNYFYNKKLGFILEKDINLFAFDNVGVVVLDSDLNRLLTQNAELSDSFNLDNVIYYGNAKSYFSNDYAAKLFCGVCVDDSDNRSFFPVVVDENLKYNFSEYRPNSFKNNI